MISWICFPHSVSRSWSVIILSGRTCSIRGWINTFFAPSHIAEINNPGWYIPSVYYFEYWWLRLTANENPNLAIFENASTELLNYLVRDGLLSCRCWNLGEITTHQLCRPLLNATNPTGDGKLEWDMCDHDIMNKLKTLLPIYILGTFRKQYLPIKVKCMLFFSTLWINTAIYILGYLWTSHSNVSALM